MKEFAKRLKRERELRSWSQEQLAQMIGTTAPNVSRWERSVTFPSLYFRQKLGETFGKTVEEFHLLETGGEDSRLAPEQKAEAQGTLSALPGASSVLWNLPHPRNLHFTGREEMLVRLHHVLNADSLDDLEALTPVLAISGLGGIGKTELALEYIYRYSDEYQAVFWVRADTHEALIADFAAIANMLDLPSKVQQDQRQSAEMLKRWFEQHTAWLLILDNLEEFSLLHQFISFKSKGHTLLTTRFQFTGSFFQRADLQKMEPYEGALLLLRRAKRIGPKETLAHASPSDRTIAREISQFLDGLPLALDQAGAYIEEAACSLAHYFDLLEHLGGNLLGLRNLSGGGNVDHPHSVHTTLSLSFEQLKQTTPAAIDLLRLCAFLHPEAIPEEMILKGFPYLGPSLQHLVSDPLKFDAAIAEIRRHSLLCRDPETQTFTLHRLVQAVLRDEMDEGLQRLWATRAVLVVNHSFPDVDHWVTSSLCRRYLSHAQVCAALIEQWDIECVEAGRLLTQLSCFMYELAQYELTQYAQAEPLLKKALTILTKLLGTEHPAIAEARQILGWVYTDLGNYAQAESCYQQALAVYERMPEPDYRSISGCLSDLAESYEGQGKYALAEPLYREALRMTQLSRGFEHLDVAIGLRNMGMCYTNQKKYAQAEPLLLQALNIWQKGLGTEHPVTASIIHELGRLCMEQGRYVQAKPLLLQALEIRLKLLKPGHPYIALDLDMLAKLSLKQEQDVQADALLQNEC